MHDQRLWLHTSAVGTSEKTYGTSHTLVDASTVPRDETRGQCPITVMLVFICTLGGTVAVG